MIGAIFVAINTTPNHVGNLARVEVTGVHTLKSGRMIVELRPGAKKER